METLGMLVFATQHTTYVAYAAYGRSEIIRINRV